jgi:hypothetical protein
MLAMAFMPIACHPPHAQNPEARRLRDPALLLNDVISAANQERTYRQSQTVRERRERA